MVHTFGIKSREGSQFKISSQRAILFDLRALNRLSSTTCSVILFLALSQKIILEIRYLVLCELISVVMVKNKF